MNSRKLVLSALLIAMCFIGANVKLMGSIAFDSAPAFIGTLLVGPIFGMILGFFGHMLSALLAGFPLSLPIHFIVAVTMALTMFFYGFVRKKAEEKFNHTYAVALSIITAFILNVPVAVLALYPMLKGVVIAMFPALAIAAICNIAVAEIVYKALPMKWKNYYAVKVK
ncbi:MAG: ECF transporter S component [Bacillus sp. (in: firmicutes)]